MPLWPVAAREAKAAARAPRTYGWRAGVTAVGILMIPISLYLARMAPSQGRAVFLAISGMAFAYCLFGGVARTADAIAEEKRENTLGLLFLTDLKVGDVIFGKLLASSATLFFGLLALMPLLAIPALLGGVASRDLWQMAICLVNTLFYSISFGFLVSTFFRQGWVTVCVGIGLMLALCVAIPFALGYFYEFLVPMTPTGMFVAITVPNTLDFWQAVVATQLVSWLNLLYTAHYLPKFWQERPRSKRAQIWWERMRRMRFGGTKTRTQFRRRLLNRNPLYWLSGREQVSSMGLMGFLMFMAALSLSSEWQGVFYGLFVMHATVLMRMASAASHALAEDRKSGALELLLATSLSARDVLKGRWMALGRQFLGPILIVGLWHLFTILWMGVMSPIVHITLPLATAALGIILAWIATGWFGMWMGLRARHPITAIWKTLMMTLLLPWLAMGGFFALLAFLQMLPERQFGGDSTYVAIGCLGWSFYLFALIAWTIHRIKKGFREAATDRYSDTQPVDWRPFWSLCWKVAGATAVIVVAALGWRASINFRGERALKAVIAAHPEYQTAPPKTYVPDNQNLARWSYLDISKPSPQVGFVQGTNAPPPATLAEALARRGTGVDPDPWRLGAVRPIGSYGINASVRQFESGFVALHAAARERPSIYYSPPDSVQQPQAWHHIWLRRIVNVLALRAIERLDVGEKPLDDIFLGVRFANSLTNEPLSLSPRRLALYKMIQPVYDGIHAAKWNDADLQSIQEVFGKIEVWPHYETFRHAIVRDVARIWVNPPSSAAAMGGRVLIAGVGFYSAAPPTGHRLPGRVKLKEAELIRMGLEELWPTPSENHPRIRNSVPFWRDRSLEESLISGMTYGLEQGMREAAQIKTAADQVVAACAIERFRLAEGRLPTALAELTPKFLKAIPNDLMTGAPLTYRLENNGYILYSIAMDGVDHRGKPEHHQGPGPRGAGDWVWKYQKP